MFIPSKSASSKNNNNNFIIDVVIYNPIYLDARMLSKSNTISTTYSHTIFFKQSGYQSSKYKYRNIESNANRVICICVHPKRQCESHPKIYYRQNGNFQESILPKSLSYWIVSDVGCMERSLPRKYGLEKASTQKVRTRAQMHTRIWMWSCDITFVKK